MSLLAPDAVPFNPPIHPPQSCVLCDSHNVTTAEPVVLSCDGYLGTPAVSQATLS